MTETTSNTTECNLVIVGSGPAGLTAAIYAARAQLEPILLEGSVTAGGALMNTTEVENFPGFPEGIQGPELMMNLRAQAERFGVRIVTDDAVELDLTGDIKVIKDGEGREYRSPAVILSMGARYRELGIPGEKELSGHGVSWCATCDGFFFKDQNIVVVGGGDSAMEEATFLTRFANKVTLIHRRDEFRASKIMVERALNDPKIDVIYDTAVTEATGDGKLSTLKLKNLKTDEESELEATGLFIAIGHDPSSELVKGQVDTNEEGYVAVQGRSQRTNLDGVFACGDLVDFTYRQAITAAGSGCAAALDAERWLADRES
ncbi:MAG: thioredoxin-disulfide reductase [Candidatus Nanopelagicales bacterium]